VKALLDGLQHYGLAVVFVNVLLSQLGMPLPAWPALIVTGALSARGDPAIGALLATALAASLIADALWYAAGRRYGGGVLKTLCRVSISPDSCVRQTESLFSRWGVPSLAVAKFVPGFAVIATTLAGNLRVSFARFLLFDAIGATLWAGVPIALGRVFYDAIAVLLEHLDRLGHIGLAVVGLGFALFLVFRAYRRWAFRRRLRMARISVEDLHALQKAGAEPVILDVRTADSRARHGHVPGSIAWAGSEGRDDRLEVPRDREVVVYCSCPNEASAALVAQRLLRAGFVHVRPLHGGIDAWVAAGLPLEREA
jgi:membrane protein DedA with SNARE-associated domain/rhodanese-related sulfurtransferase